MTNQAEELPHDEWERVKEELKGSKAEKLDAIQTLQAYGFHLPGEAQKLILDLTKTDQPEAVRMKLASIVSEGKLPMGLYIQLSEALENDPSENVQAHLERHRKRTKELSQAMNGALESLTTISSLAYDSTSRWVETYSRLTENLTGVQEALRLSELHSELFSWQQKIAQPLIETQRWMENIGLVGKNLTPFLEATRLANRMLSVPARPTLSFYPPRELEEAIEPPEAPPTQSGRVLASKLRSLSSGQSSWRIFEDICEEILTYCLVPPLMEPHSQSQTSGGLHIRDIIFHIPYDIGEFWFWLKVKFESTALIVEAKNHSSPLEPNQVVIASKYLGSKRLGTLGVIVSRKGFGPGAIKQRNSLWREDDKLILGLTDEHLLKMLELKDEGKDPAKVIDAEIRRFFEDLA